VTTDGRIKVRGRGLLLGSGNRIGQNGNLSIFATLICEAAARSTSTAQRTWCLSMQTETFESTMC